MTSDASVLHHPSGLSVDEITMLRSIAEAAAERAYAPYSKFRVGAAVLLEDGGVVAGCNVENASYRLTTCAEQGAIAAAVVERGPGVRIRAVAVMNLNGGVPCMPCGACRQTILEFATPECWVFYPGEDGMPMEAPFSALLPAAFRLAH